MALRSDTGRFARYGLYALLVGCFCIRCASPGDSLRVYQRGEIAPNVYLSTVIVRPGGCAPFGVACTMAGPNGAVLIVPFAEETPEWMYEIFAHELCHVVAGVQALPKDPCHKEDGGAIRPQGPVPGEHLRYQGR